MILDCEWNLEQNRPLTLKEFWAGKSHAKAVYLLGYEEQLAVCEECAKSPMLKKYKTRKLIEEEAA